MDNLGVRNKAAERLHPATEQILSVMRTGLSLFAHPEVEREIDAAVREALDSECRAERRATVEAMANEVEARIRSGAYLTYHAGPSNLVRDAALAVTGGAW